MAVAAVTWPRESEAMDRDSSTAQMSQKTTPPKLCTVCGGTILWRRRLAGNWDKIVYCSASCRRVSLAKARTEGNDRAGAHHHLPAESAASAA
jgi:hypothetical protein